MTLVLRYAARSDRGLVRANNEDSVYAGARLLALADGMGGHAAGEVASQLVIAALAHLDDDEPGGDLLAKLDVAVREGNAAIAAHVENDPELEGMGTTLTAILFAGNKLGLVHIGDSRGYMLRDGELAQITKDDTFVQTLVDEGRITAEEAHSHPQRSLIMRALTGHDVEPTLIMREARTGDRYLLCSDGLSDPVSQETILEALQIPDVAESADRLIELALRGGGPDNVTVVVADVVDYDYGQTQPILAGAVSGDDDQIAPPNTSAGRASAFNPKRAAVAKRIVAEADAPTKRPRSWRRIILGVTLLVLLAVAGLIVGRYIIRTNYYVTAHNGTVSIMRGVQGLPAGLSLSGAIPARLPDASRRAEDHQPWRPAKRLPSAQRQRLATDRAHSRCSTAYRRANTTTPSSRCTSWWRRRSFRCARQLLRCPPPRPRRRRQHRRRRLHRRRPRLRKAVLRPRPALSPCRRNPLRQGHFQRPRRHCPPPVPPPPRP